MLGRRLAARVLHSYFEDFVNEDTGECVSIERNEVIIERETVLEEQHIQQILDVGVKNILLHREVVRDESDRITDYSVIFNTLNKDTCNSEKEAVEYIYRQSRSRARASPCASRPAPTIRFATRGRILVRVPMNPMSSNETTDRKSVV